MIAALSHFFVLPALPDVAPAPPKKVYPPLFIGDVATPHLRTTEFHIQWTASADQSDQE